jgi:hypothetical protein
MTGLPEFFTQTSDKSYDRHSYQVVSQSGESYLFDSYMDAQATWFSKGVFLSHINVIDKAKLKKKKGF